MKLTAQKKEISVYALIEIKSKQIRYIGVTSRDISKRFSHHIECSKSGSKFHVHRWLRKIKFRAIPILLEIIKKGFSWKKAEQKWISYHKSKGTKLTNMTDGGEGIIGFKMSKATRIYLSKIRKGKTFPNRKISKEDRIKISERQKGKLGYWYNKKFSKSHRMKISKFMKGRKHSLGIKPSKALIKRRTRHMKGNRFAAGVIFTKARREAISKRMIGKKYALKKRII